MIFFTLLSFFSLISASEIALYWGQNSAGTEQSLASYCQNSPGDIYIISFVNGFGNGGAMSMNIHGYYNTISGTSLLDASELGQQIQTCQQLGKKVLVSLGGASGAYGLSSDADANNVAQQLWDYFGGGSSSTRPFGQGVKVDGFDLDIENAMGASQYATLANKLYELYQTDSSKKYYTTAAPQCPFPDASVGKAIAGAHFDYLFIQFYNNYCSLLGGNFNMDTWQSFATSSPNPAVKLMVGLPGAQSAAGSGYATIDDVKAKFSEMTSASNFGGFMLWDASQGNSNIIGGKSFVQQLQDLIGSSGDSVQVTAAKTTSQAATTSEAAKTTSEAAVTTSQAAVTTSQAAVTTSQAAAATTSEAAAATTSEAAAVAATTAVQTTSQWATTPGVIPGYTPGVVTPVVAQTTPYSNTSATTYTTVTGFVTLTVNKVTSTTPYAGGPAQEATAPATVVHAWTSVVPLASASVASSIEYNKAVKSVSLSLLGSTAEAAAVGAATPAAAAPAAAAPAAAQVTIATNVNEPNGTWINTWNYNYASAAAAAPVTYSGEAGSTSVADPTTTVFLTSTIYHTAASTTTIYGNGTVHW